MITHLEPDILECEVKWASESITMNKASGGDRTPAEQFLTDKELEENQRQIKSFRDSYDRYTAQIERNNEEIRDKQSIIRKNNAKIKELDSIRSSSEVAK